MNKASNASTQSLWPVISKAAQALFQDGTDQIHRELPLGELALSALDINQRARALHSGTDWPQHAPCTDSGATLQAELPIGELALSSLAIGQHARQLGCGEARQVR